MSIVSKISVIMSVYNGEKYLSEAIESVLGQTYKNFEFIIINDGSKDKSLEIIKKYKNLDERIILITRENKGLVVSLNEGIQKANGKYIVRMDADDICLPTRFEEQLEYMKNHQLDLCGSWVETFNDKTISTVWKYPENHNDIIFRSFFMCSFAHPSVMINKVVFEKLRYGNEVAEDYSLWCDILSNGYKSGNIQKVLLKYRLHKNQLTQRKSKELINSANHIRLNFSQTLDFELNDIVKQSIKIQNDNRYKNFNKLLESVLIVSKKYDLHQENLDFILENLYNNASPKNPLCYFSYYRVKKNKKNCKNELNLFFKSFIIFKRDSKVYQFIKKVLG